MWRKEFNNKSLSYKDGICPALPCLWGLSHTVLLCTSFTPTLQMREQMRSCLRPESYCVSEQIVRSRQLNLTTWCFHFKILSEKSMMVNQTPLNSSSSWLVNSNILTWKIVLYYDFPWINLGNAKTTFWIQQRVFDFSMPNSNLKCFIILVKHRCVRYMKICIRFSKIISFHLHQ